MSITKQRVAIIGAGDKMGAEMAKRIAGDNYRLLLFDQDIEILSDLEDTIYQAHPEADVRVMNYLILLYILSNYQRVDMSLT